MMQLCFSMWSLHKKYFNEGWNVLDFLNFCLEHDIQMLLGRKLKTVSKVESKPHSSWKQKRFGCSLVSSSQSTPSATRRPISSMASSGSHRSLSRQMSSWLSRITASWQVEEIKSVPSSNKWAAQVYGLPLIWATSCWLDNLHLTPWGSCLH